MMLGLLTVEYQGQERVSSVGPWRREQLFFDVKAPVTMGVTLGVEKKEAIVDIARILAGAHQVDTRVALDGGYVRVSATLDVTTSLRVGDVVAPSGAVPWSGPRRLIVEAIGLDRVLVAYYHLGAACRVAVPRSGVVSSEDDDFDDVGEDVAPQPLPIVAKPQIGIPVASLLHVSMAGEGGGGVPGVVRYLVILVAAMYARDLIVGKEVSKEPPPPSRVTPVAEETTAEFAERNFLELRKFLEERYNLDSIEAEHYPPPAHGVVAAQIAGMAQMATVVLLFVGDRAFTFLGLPVPSWYGLVAENKMMTFAVVWLANNFANSLVATGAFEIYLDDRLVFSKLETGRLPTVQDLVSGLKQNGLKPISSSNNNNNNNFF
ncbi:hypothetical protein CTAYLR_004511 [Chrysophaeum taylorii]|uniref:Selenoprotein T n=1 Tax=Chrysophaeum taylorii TaxID=2483200 RepID=A0AAD7UA28_9STRA|nr:hypothetical protein CTAYLR_004511 [Chrysophaeum taylorii]